ncbi:penicillin-binding transpeptidase domain-containing protein [Hathewaya histolytica]|uniref:Peptidoglycanglycosyltransferase n=1 Tax=Hathewaya histolytica TaxID=1498 RepID=A0A4U9RNC0_HATHI|nr:penicillin-binding transpeptidase domain-containing protein [Hathewaya histolytica]VTQ90370.1 peptidoglycanglycosyltransferase [Hathewaya histolytica]
MLKEKKSILFFLPPRKYENRLITVSIILIMVFLFFIGRYAYIVIIEGEQLKSKANNQFYYSESIIDRNYKLLDRNGKDLISYDKKYFAVIDPSFYIRFNPDKNNDNIKKAKYILRDFNKTYNFPDELKKLDYGKKLKYEVDEETYDKLNQITSIKGFYMYSYDKSKLEKDWNILSIMDNANNYLDSSPKSSGTLEKTMFDIRKENRSDRVLVQKEVDNKLYKEVVKKEENNLNFRLTLDKDIQKVVEGVIREKGLETYKDIGVILMESSTGKILSMAQKDDKRPNINIGAASNHGYFPGSIFKIITAAAGIDKNITSINKVYKRDKNIKEYNGFNSLSLKQSIIQSSNDILYQLGEEVGFKNIYDYSKKFGLLTPMLGLQDEVSGDFEVDLNHVSRDEVRHSAIGQKIRITPLQAINIPNIIVNKGNFVRPYIIDSIVDDNNKEVKEIHTVAEKVIKNSTAKTLENTMIQVVEAENGTGRNAKVKGVKVGGKTGTSEYYEIKDGKRIKHSDGWFAGFFNLKGKNYSMVILVRDIDWMKKSSGGKEEDGGSVAAPIFKDIVEILKEKNLLK